MRRALAVVGMGLLVGLAGWGLAEATPSSSAAPGVQPAAAPQPAAKAAAPAAASPAVAPAAESAKPSAEAAATDPAAAYQARQAALKQAQDLARTRRTVASRMNTRPSIDFQQASVKTVLDYLAEVGRFSVVYDEALKDAGIDLEARTVDISARGLTYEKVLQLILPRECGYRVESGYVLITTLEKSWLPLKTATYSIRLAMSPIPNFTDAPRFEVAEVIQGAAQAGGGGGAGSLFGGGATTETDDQGLATPEKIVDLIRRFVSNQNDRRIAPWDDEGGPATLNVLGGNLIVSQTDAGHAAVARILAMIE
jgi:hypothetical protein